MTDPSLFIFKSIVFFFCLVGWLVCLFVGFKELADKVIGGMFSVRLKKLRKCCQGPVEVLGIILGEAYECVLVAIFMSLTWFASANIQAITEDVENRYSSSCSVSSNQVIYWKRSYNSVIEFIEEIGSAFGPTLLVLVGKQFVYFVVYSFGILVQIVENGPMVFSLIYNLRNICLMCIVIAGAQRMKSKVRADRS